ncbi:MAG: hypothetical protein AAGI38_20410 [Bacteroidota bacterium]
MESDLFDQIGQDLSGNKRSSILGVPCFKIGRKPFLLFVKDQIVCKLYGEVNEEALQLPGASFFSPMENAKPMKNWVQIPVEHADTWPFYAQLAYQFIKEE